MSVTLYYTRTMSGRQVRALHADLEAAKAQALHDEAQSSERVTDRIEDENGVVLWTSPSDGTKTWKRPG